MPKSFTIYIANTHELSIMTIIFPVALHRLLLSARGLGID